MTASAPQRSLVVGVSGQVGNQIANLLGSSHVIGARRSGARPGELTVDLAELADHPEKSSKLLREADVDAVYCAGAMTNVDGCESAADVAMKVNCHGPASLAAAAAEAGIPFVFFSTDYVFDGQSGPYSEDDEANPISAYGRSKWMGEVEVRKAHPGALIVRTTVVYGVDPAGKNFLYSLRRACVEGRPFRAAIDQVSTPTYNNDLAAAVVGLVQTGKSGVFHVCGPERMNRYEFAIAAARAMGISCEKLTSATTEELKQIAQRPLNSGLRTEKLARALPGLRLHRIEEAVREWMAEESALRNVAR